MVIGVHGESGELVLLSVVKEHVQRRGIVITLSQRMEGKVVMLMGLLMENPKVVTADLVVVYNYFSINILCLHF